MSSLKNSLGLRTVAVFEASKGILVLVLGSAVLTLARHQGLDEVAARLTELLHVNPDGRLSNLFFSAANHATDRNLWVLAAAAAIYAAVRFTEAFGLWKERAWAEWFALLSGSLYLPWEIYAILRRPDALRWSLLVGNVVIVIYMAWLRASAAAARAAEGARPPVHDRPF